MDELKQKLIDLVNSRIEDVLEQSNSLPLESRISIKTFKDVVLNTYEEALYIGIISGLEAARNELSEDIDLAMEELYNQLILRKANTFVPSLAEDALQGELDKLGAEVEEDNQKFEA